MDSSEKRVVYPAGRSNHAPTSLGAVSSAATPKTVHPGSRTHSTPPRPTVTTTSNATGSDLVDEGLGLAHDSELHRVVGDVVHVELVGHEP